MIKKRQICKECKESGYRFDARKIPGNHYPFYEGEAEYDSCWVAINMTPYNTGKLVMIGYTMKGIKMDTIKKLLYSGCNELHRL